jgi:hypothetical protein
MAPVRAATASNGTRKSKRMFFLIASHEKKRALLKRLAIGKK